MGHDTNMPEGEGMEQKRSRGIEVQVECGGCGRTVKMRGYVNKEAYQCSKCRGVNTPKRPPKVREEKRFGNFA